MILLGAVENVTFRHLLYQANSLTNLQHCFISVRNYLWIYNSITQQGVSTNRKKKIPKIVRINDDCTNFEAIIPKLCTNLQRLTTHEQPSFTVLTTSVSSAASPAVENALVFPFAWAQLILQLHDLEKEAAQDLQMAYQNTKCQAVLQKSTRHNPGKALHQICRRNPPSWHLWGRNKPPTSVILISQSEDTMQPTVKCH